MWYGVKVEDWFLNKLMWNIIFHDGFRLNNGKVPLEWEW